MNLAHHLVAGHFVIAGPSFRHQLAPMIKKNGRHASAPCDSRDALAPVQRRLDGPECLGRTPPASPAFTQDALAAGVTTGAIQQAGGWKSERMVLRYGGRICAKESAATLLAQLQGR